MYSTECVGIKKVLVIPRLVDGCVCVCVVYYVMSADVLLPKVNGVWRLVSVSYLWLTITHLILHCRLCLITDLNIEYKQCLTT